MKTVLFLCLAAIFIALIAAGIIALRRGGWWKNHSWELPERESSFTDTKWTGI